jgi:hypothetical protein
MSLLHAINTIPEGHNKYPILRIGDPDPDMAFSKSLCHEFIEAINSGKLKTKKLLTHDRWSSYRRILMNPTETSSMNSPDARQRDANTKHHCLTHFEFDKDTKQIYRQAGVEKGQYYLRRYAATLWDAANIVALNHCRLHHASRFRTRSPYAAQITNLFTEVDKVYQKCNENYYGISIQVVKWILSQCAQCKLSEHNQGKAALKPIVADHCLDRLTIDLMDFTGNPDGDYKYVLQMKDHFSRFVWAYALKDKAAATIADILRPWFKVNGYPLKL